MSPEVQSPDPGRPGGGGGGDGTRRTGEKDRSGGSGGGHRHHRERIGNYVFDGEIGRGSFATVFKGHRSKTRQPIAIKVVSRQKLTTKLLENLDSEINILKAISHRNIVGMEDCFKSETHIYLVMEYCSGSDLSIYIKNRGRLPTLDYLPRGAGPDAEKAFWPHPPVGGIDERVTRCFLGQLAQALKFLRSQDLIHRDIKPQNLLLQPATADEMADGHPLGIPVLKVADFGFARILPATAMAETLCGSPLYMAPEILRYEKYDAKADLWSVGAVLFEMAVGRPPFRANNHVELLRRIEKGEDKIKFPDESSKQPNPADSQAPQPIPVPGDIKTLIRGLLKRHPTQRMGFDEFFASGTWEGYLTESKSTTEDEEGDGEGSGSLSFDASTDSSALGLPDESQRAKMREALEESRISEGRRGSLPRRAPQPLSTDMAMNPRPAPRPPQQSQPSSPATGTLAREGLTPLSPRPTRPPPRRTEPKYYVSNELSGEAQPRGPGGRSTAPTPTPPPQSSTATPLPFAQRDSRPGTGIGAPSPRRQSTTTIAIHTRDYPTSTTREVRPSQQPPPSNADQIPHSPSTPSQTGTVTAGPAMAGRRGVGEGSPLAATPPITFGGGHGNTGKESSALEADDSVVGREYVVVEKRTVEVNALADELDQASRKTDALIRRPSSRTSVVTRPVSSFKPTSTPAPLITPQPNAVRAASPQQSPSAQVAQAPSNAQNALVQQSYSPPFALSGTPPFAIPPFARAASGTGASPVANAGTGTGNAAGMVAPPISRSNSATQGITQTSAAAASPSSLGTPGPGPSSQGTQGVNVFPPVPVQQMYDPTPLPHPSIPRYGSYGSYGSYGNSYGSSPSSLQTGALARALTNTAIRLIGTSANAAGNVLARATSAKRRPTIVRSGEGIDGEEDELLRSVEDYARKAFVLFELADSRLLAWQGLATVNLPSAPGSTNVGPGVGAGGTSAGGPGAGGSRRKSSSSSINSEIAMLRQQETTAGEAVVLYCKALQFIVGGTNRIQRYWAERAKKGDVQTSSELNDMVQWLRARFNECFDKAEWAKSKCAEELPFVDRLLHDKAKEMSRHAALAELQGDFLNAEAGYETGLWLSQALIDSTMYEEGELRTEDKISIERLTNAIKTRLDALKKKMADAGVSSKV